MNWCRCWFCCWFWSWLIFWSWWFIKYLTCIGYNLITILQLLMKRYLHWFVINLVILLHIVLYILNTFKVWNVTYTSLYFSNADRTRSVTKRNCSNTNNLCWNRHTLNNTSICIVLYILITNMRYFEYFNTLDILFPDFFPLLNGYLANLYTYFVFVLPFFQVYFGNPS